jgi:patatin-related protein
VKRGCDPDVEDDHFCPYWTPALAFAARASSSIPGVFPPLGLPHALRTIGPAAGGTLQHEAATDFFRNYQLQNPAQDDSYLDKTFFVDGGVLDNHPFDPAIAEIFKRSQNQEVRRFLVYLQPDPGMLPAAPSGKYPSLLPTIWAGLSGLPSGQPILDSLTDVAEHNVRLDRLRDIVRAEEQAARAKERESGGGGDCSNPTGLPVAERFACAVGVAPENVDARLATATVPELAELRHKLERVAREGTNELADRSYVSVRVHSVLDQLVTVIASEKACNYPPDSAHRALVRKIVEQWAAQRKLIGSPENPGGDLQAQLAFLEEFDVGYLRRQLRFVVDWINIQYEGDEEGNLPDPARRRQLDAVKAAASREIEELTAFVDGESAQLAGRLGKVRSLFGNLRPWKGVGELNQSLDEQAAAFVRDPGKLADLDALRDELGRQLVDLQQKVRTDSFEAFKKLTADWDAADRREILVRYLGFPFWDRQIYPLLAFADIGEFDQVKVYRLSPDDATLLGGGPASQKLTGAKAAHFGAFLSRRGREGDYLWGRLDAGERMLKLLGLSTAGAKPLFMAILDEEQKAGHVRSSILADRRKQVAGLP